MSGSTRALSSAPHATGWLRLFAPTLLATFNSSYGWQSFKNDVFGGLTAAVVALPLALAFGGTPAQVSGPTGPMTVVLGAIVATHSQSLPMRSRS